ncbi:MAG: hypothetical protein M0P91_05425 [Sulfuricurvum sp.]|jgi:hypothetical protein|uniref:hypothetical protein n=1 Tax=Sulfuricurvum sp. TaxID=2025608 RepID=UPI0025E3F0DF|nr:hypothetical protein [Sulfuricurvum sp.]MCK9372617.1 hypothetical protein [Sulfuricurvum sp.]
MTNIDIQQVFTSMVEAASGVFDKKWPGIKDYAEAEFKKLAITFAQIETLKLSGQISEAEASVLLEMQKNTTRAVMLALEGMSLLLVEEAINAALAVVKDSINTVLGFALI